MWSHFHSSNCPTRYFNPPHPTYFVQRGWEMVFLPFYSTKSAWLVTSTCLYLPPFDAWLHQQLRLAIDDVEVSQSVSQAASQQSWQLVVDRFHLGSFLSGLRWNARWMRPAARLQSKQCSCKECISSPAPSTLMGNRKCLTLKSRDRHHTTPHIRGWGGCGFGANQVFLLLPSAVVFAIWRSADWLRQSECGTNVRVFKPPHRGIWRATGGRWRNERALDGLCVGMTHNSIVHGNVDAISNWRQIGCLNSGFQLPLIVFPPPLEKAEDADRMRVEPTFSTTFGS